MKTKRNRMIRKQVYIEPRQEKVLKSQARLRAVTEAEVIREAIDLLDRYNASSLRISNSDGWETFRKLVAQARFDAGTAAYVWKRDDAYGPRAGFPDNA